MAGTKASLKRLWPLGHRANVLNGEWTVKDRPWRSSASRARREQILMLLAKEVEETARSKGRITFVANPSTTRRIAKVHIDDCQYAPLQSVVPYDSLMDALRDGYHPCRVCLAQFSQFFEDP